MDQMQHTDSCVVWGHYLRSSPTQPDGQAVKFVQCCVKMCPVAKEMVAAVHPAGQSCAMKPASSLCLSRTCLAEQYSLQAPSKSVL
jgi:hypothetical protein